jgi:hypothetical protein
VINHLNKKDIVDKSANEDLILFEYFVGFGYLLFALLTFEQGQGPSEIK